MRCKTVKELVVHKCACGCGFAFDTTKAPYCYPSYRRDHKYVVGHQPYKSGFTLSAEVKLKISKSVKATMANPELRKHLSDVKRKQHKNGLKVWNVGLTKEAFPDNPYVKRRSEWMSYPKSQKTKNKISKTLRDGYASGRISTQNGEYKHYKTGWAKTPFGRFYCDSGSEREFIKALNYEKIKHIQKNYGIPYIFQNKKRTFLVDFYIEYKDGRKELVEIKGCHFGHNSYCMIKAKVLAAKKYAEENNMEWRLIWTGNRIKEGSRHAQLQS